MSYANQIEFIKAEFKNYYIDKGPENGVLQGTKFAGAATHARNCLFTLVKMLKPKNCLEIGSMHYESSDAMANAMDIVHGVDTPGRVDSFDIKRGGYTGEIHRVPTNKRVTQNYWYSFPTDYDDWKYNDPLIVYPQFAKMSVAEIRLANFEILHQRSKDIGGKYDLIFVDGDHSFDGAKEDFDMALRFSHRDTIIVLDNVWDKRLKEVRRFYDSLPHIKWDFDEWNEEHYAANMVMDNAVVLTY